MPCTWVKLACGESKSEASFAPPVVHRDIKPANILLEFDKSSQESLGHSLVTPEKQAGFVHVSVVPLPGMYPKNMELVLTLARSAIRLNQPMLHHVAFFRTFPKIYLVDFGSAVLGSGTKTAAGTFGYMAPESFGNSFTPKSDLQLVATQL